jgi:hypothetical protein
MAMIPHSGKLPGKLLPGGDDHRKRERQNEGAAGFVVA